MSFNENGNGVVSPHHEHDEEREYQLCRLVRLEKKEEAENARDRRVNACDLTGHEFAIVCEELWVNHRENTKNCLDKTGCAVKRNIGAILSVSCLFPLVYGKLSRSMCWRDHVEFCVRVVSLCWRSIGWSVSRYYRILCWHFTFTCAYEYQDAFPGP